MRWYSLKGVPRGSKNGSGASIRTRAEAFFGWSRQGRKSLALGSDLPIVAARRLPLNPTRAVRARSFLTSALLMCHNGNNPREDAGIGLSHRAGGWRRHQAGNMRVALLTSILLALAVLPLPVHAQPGDFVLVTDEMLQSPASEDWLTWRRTRDAWGYSPLDQINRDTVGSLRKVWSHSLPEGRGQGTPLVYRGAMYMPGPAGVIQAINAASGDLLWTHPQEHADEYRNIAIRGDLIIGVMDGHVFALSKEVWDADSWSDSELSSYAAGYAPSLVRFGTGSTDALHGGTGDGRLSYRDPPPLLIDTPLAPESVAWISSEIDRGEVRRVATSILGTTGVVYTHDRETGELLWVWAAEPQNVDENGRVTVNSTSEDQEVFTCRQEAGAYSPRTNAIYVPFRNACAETGGAIEAISVVTGKTLWGQEQNAVPKSLVATGGGLVFGGDDDGHFRAFNDETGNVLWEFDFGSSVLGSPITYAVDDQQFLAVSTERTLVVFTADPPYGRVPHEFLQQCLEEWQEVLVDEDQDHATYVSYLDSSIREMPEYASEAARMFWAEEFRELDEDGFKGQFRFERVNFETTREPAGAFRAYPLMDDGELRESLLIRQEDGSCEILRIFG